MKKTVLVALGFILLAGAAIAQDPPQRKEPSPMKACQTRICSKALEAVTDVLGPGFPTAQRVAEGVDNADTVAAARQRLLTIENWARNLPVDQWEAYSDAFIRFERDLLAAEQELKRPSAPAVQTFPRPPTDILR